MAAVTPTAPPAPALSSDEEAVVRALGRAILVVPRALDADLLSEHGLSLSEYAALRQLNTADDHRMRMSDLSTAVDLSVSGMTRMVTRLENAGLVERAKCDEDARGLNAVLTEAGRARLEQATPTYVASVRRHVLDHLDGIELTRLADALQQFGAASCGEHC
jgi:DNA-binding MarR family transcriptional regulator